MRRIRYSLIGLYRLYGVSTSAHSYNPQPEKGISCVLVVQNPYSRCTVAFGGSLYISVVGKALEESTR